ncbi:hypothetical protein [Pseudomonas sp. Irchel 3E13]|uniref:hypothetical protein n=1 Tax=Pseudomonas sp. Irchel 3E13 TaxID=2008975 RepID=UPI000BA3E81E|nr:hypothetical protein [Pseudomonas sp. Irchel 3E13]
MTISKDQSFTAVYNGVEFTATIDPCSWMYPGYGVQLTVKLQNGSTGSLNNKPLSFNTATTDDVQKMLSGVRLLACKTCDSSCFDPASVKTNQDGKCYSCIMRELRAELDADTQNENAEIAKLDAKYKKQGCTHRIDAWIHPARGDDFSISFWMKNPTVEEIQATIRKNKSTVLDDYNLVAL